MSFADASRLAHEAAVKHRKALEQSGSDGADGAQSSKEHLEKATGRGCVATFLDTATAVRIVE